MAYEFYVTVEGQKQGKFKNATPRGKRKAKIPGISFHYNIRSPRDSTTGQASGKRTHGPVSFVKAWGPSTPQFFQALCTNEVLPSVLFEFPRSDPNGREYIHHTVELVNATVSEVEQYVTDDRQRSPAQDTQEFERISLTFQRIEIQNKDGKTMAVDDWFQKG